MHDEVKKAIKKSGLQKSTPGDDVPEEVLKLVGDNSQKVMTQLINDIHETAQKQCSNESLGSIKLGEGEGRVVSGLAEELSASHAGLLSM